ncbi:hypothetical protein GCG21_12935 [Pseudactinotalea sp. HY160]|uniref:hypothetical protein n=1 Tax=Pseudactinotalea sp. HY160 TaxID=2654490 RepID=UPI00128CAEFA|nr:hypothetical protein [Pseudactinotalea sp. HY160]MPV50895.1 hypothetical protein [Pseudactinotalea sp. HY160]
MRTDEQPEFLGTARARSRAVRAVRASALGRRSWTWGRGAPLLVAVGTVAGVVIATAWTTTQPRSVQLLAVAGVLAAGAAAFAATRALVGAIAVRRRIERERRAWAEARGWAYAGAETAADPATAGLVLPRGWRAPVAFGSLRGVIGGREALVQSWHLRSASTSKRQSTYREIVSVRARTRGHRVAVLSGVGLDPALMKPAWVDLRTRERDRRDRGSRAHVDGDPRVLDTWGAAIRSAVDARADLPVTVVAGADRVVVCALDDPRIATAQERLELAVEVARIVDPTGR